LLFAFSAEIFFEASALKPPVLIPDLRSHNANLLSRTKKSARGRLSAMSIDGVMAALTADDR
jgi:hypothetical protein